MLRPCEFVALQVASLQEHQQGKDVHYQKKGTKRKAGHDQQQQLAEKTKRKQDGEWKKLRELEEEVEEEEQTAREAMRRKRKFLLREPEGGGARVLDRARLVHVAIRQHNGDSTPPAL